MTSSASKSLLEIPDLPVDAFRLSAGRMRLHGKADTPDAPDYASLARDTAQGNLQLARAGASANRIDQSTPYGSIAYTRGSGIDQDRYNQYLAQQADLATGTNTADKLAWYKNTGRYIADGDWIKDPDKWTSTITLSPDQQALLDSRTKQNSALNWAGDSLANQAMLNTIYPMDISDVPGLIYNVDSATGMGAWDRATDLIRQRQNPQLDAQQSALDTKLANMGLTPGSEGWALQQRQFGQQRNDADIAAQLAGLQAQEQFYGQALSNAGLNNQTRQQSISERADLRSLPLKELQQMRSTASLTNPSFSQPGMQQLTAGADLSGAGQSQYGAAVNAANAQNQQAATQVGAGVGLLAAAASFY